MTNIFSHLSSNFNQILLENDISIAFTSVNPYSVNIVSCNSIKRISSDSQKSSPPRAISVINNELAVSVDNAVLFYKKIKNNFILERIREMNVSSHDVYYNDEIYYVDTPKSCISKINKNGQQELVWKPWWITSEEEDISHLNGMCFVDNELHYATAFSDSPHSWRNDNIDSGVVIDIKNKKIIASQLKKPHCPRWHNNKLWFLESQDAYLTTIEKGKKERKIKFPGFLRGLDFYNNLAIVGSSQIRNTNPFAEMPNANSAIYIADIVSSKILEYAILEDSINEIFDLKVIHD